MPERFSGAPSPDPEKIIPEGIGPDDAAELLDRRPLRRQLIEEYGPDAPVSAYHQDIFRGLQQRELQRANLESEYKEVSHLVDILQEVHDDLGALSAGDRALAEKYSISSRDQAMILELSAEQRINTLVAELDRFRKDHQSELADRYEVVSRFGPPEEMIPDNATQSRAFANAYKAQESTRPLEAADYVPQERREHADLFKQYHDTTTQLDKLADEEDHYKAELKTLGYMRRTDWARRSHIKDLLRNIGRAKSILKQRLTNLREELKSKGIDLPEEKQL